MTLNGHVLGRIRDELTWEVLRPMDDGGGDRLAVRVASGEEEVDWWQLLGYVENLRRMGWEVVLELPPDA